MAKILISEDSSLLREMYERIFQTSGYEVVTATDGQNALDLLVAMEVKPSVIVLDVIMPKLNGFETLKAIKENPQLQNIPVIMLTNLNSVEDRAKAEQLGAVLYISKVDVSNEEIVKWVQSVVPAENQ